MAVPVVASVAAALAVGHTLTWPNARTGPWWAAVVASAVLTSVAVGRLARRLLPLATLLRLTLAFPDRTPSRFRVALRAGSAGQLRRQVALVREHGVGDDVDAAAETVLVLAAALNAHDPQTRGHSERVRAFTEVLAGELHLPAEDVNRLRWSALLHDCGKLMVHGDVLNKKGPLTEEEWEEVRRHPEAGAKLTVPLRGWLGRWAAAIEEHHERWDGAGYPNRLAGDQLSFGARIVAVADAYEVMTSPRSYKRALSPEAARAELAREAGTQFDPVVVRAFLGISLGRAGWLASPLGWLAGLTLVRRVGSAAPRDTPSLGLTGVALMVAALLGLMGGAVDAAAVRPTAPRIAAPASTPRTDVLGEQFTAPEVVEPAPEVPPTATTVPVARDAPASTLPSVAAPAQLPPATVPAAPPAVAPTSEPCTARALEATAGTPAAEVLAAVRARHPRPPHHNPNCEVRPPGQG